MKHSRQWANQLAFTMLEVIMVIIIIGVLANVGSNLIARGFDSAFSHRNLVNASWQMRLSLFRMERELATIRSATAGDLTHTATTVTFTDIDGNRIEYNYDATDDIIERSSIGASTITAPIAHNITAATFTYLNASLATTATTSLIRCIEIDATYNDGESNFPLQTVVCPRNMDS